MNELFPDWALVIIISVLLVIMSAKSFKSGVKLHREEAAKREKRALQIGSAPSSSDEVQKCHPYIKRILWDAWYRAPLRLDACTDFVSRVQGLYHVQAHVYRHGTILEQNKEWHTIEHGAVCIVGSLDDADCRNTRPATDSLKTFRTIHKKQCWEIQKPFNTEPLAQRDR